MNQASYENDFDLIIANNLQLIKEGLFGVGTEIEVETGVAFAHFLNHVGLNHRNYQLFLKALETNNKWVVDALVGKKDPRLIFSSIRPDHGLLEKCFQLLQNWHPHQIYEKVLIAVLGYIEYNFHNADDGYKYYKLHIQDLNNIGKFLDESKSQFDPINDEVLQILDRIAILGEYDDSPEKSIISKHAFNIRIAFFDFTKALTDVIPEVLMVRLDRESEEVQPSDKFAQYLEHIDTEKIKRRKAGSKK
ncbi:MAG: hypothetical protein JXR63_12940 [Spirochaetales bacterium]|nr:hypothetical protein [Spirochaetales bacterium]